MEFPKLIYDDFYKFLMSFGAVLLFFSFGLWIAIANNLILNIREIFLLANIIFAVSIGIMYWSGEKWYKNQKLLDDKLRAETELAKQAVGFTSKTKSLDGDQNTLKIKVAESIKVIEDPKASDIYINKSPLIIYKIASVLPKTVHYNFLKDWKVWFLIHNYEDRKYKAYIKIKFISEGYEEDAVEEYYSGKRAWNLNAFFGIKAPGLLIPDKIKEKAREGKKIEIRISCEIKDENDKLIEKKLPIGYVYSYESNDWYLEP